MTDAPVPIGEHTPTADERVALHGVSWEAFESLLAVRGERSRPRVAFLDGTVELMSPSSGHEITKSMLGRAFEAYCIEHDIPFVPVGSWLIKNQAKEAGLEPDECYVFGGRPSEWTRPDLAIEVIWTRGGIAKLEIYRRLGVPEVWFWEDDEIAVFVLDAGGYVPSARSRCVPGVDLAFLCKLASTASTVNDIVRAIRETREK